MHVHLAIFNALDSYSNQYVNTRFLTKHFYTMFFSSIHSPPDSPQSDLSSDPPEKLKLSMTPSGAVDKGDLVTFGCSSDANPPVKPSGYRLFKDGHLVSRGQSLSVSDVQPSNSGQYHCQAWNSVGRRGIHYFNSTVVHLDVHCTYDETHLQY